MSRLWTPSQLGGRANGRAPTPPPDRDVPAAATGPVTCAKCGYAFEALNGHGWSICWDPRYPRISCGWFLRIYPGLMGKLASDPVLFVEPRPDGSCKRSLVYKAIRAVRDYWVREGIAQVVQEEGRTGIKLAGKHWDWAGPEVDGGDDTTTATPGATA
jgi:hypothetical protein